MHQFIKPPTQTGMRPAVNRQTASAITRKWLPWEVKADKAIQLSSTLLRKLPAAPAQFPHVHDLSTSM